MYKHILVISILLLTCSSQLFAEDIAIRFSEAQYDEISNTYDVTVQVKSTTAASLQVGHATIYFYYNHTAIQSPEFHPINLSSTSQCGTNDAVNAYKNVMGFDAKSELGEVNYSILLLNPQAACPVVENEWTDVVQFSFKKSNISDDPALTFDQELTLFNTVANDGSTHQVVEYGDLQAAITNVAVQEATSGLALEDLFMMDYQLNFSYQSTNNAAHLSVYDIQGKVVVQKDITPSNGLHKASIQLPEIKGTFYLVELYDGQQTIVQKVMVH